MKDMDDRSILDVDVSENLKKFAESFTKLDNDMYDYNKWEVQSESDIYKIEEKRADIIAQVKNVRKTLIYLSKLPVDEESEGKIADYVDEYNELMAKGVGYIAYYARFMVNAWKDSYPLFAFSEAAQNILDYEGIDPSVYSSLCENAVKRAHREAILVDGIFGGKWAAKIKDLDPFYYETAASVQTYEQAAAFTSVLESGFRKKALYEDSLKVTSRRDVSKFRARLDSDVAALEKEPWKKKEQ
jgi:hypothetical protein